MRNALFLAWLMPVIALSACGCRTSGRKSDDAMGDEDVYHRKTTDSTFETPDELKGFFKPGGRTGAWSSEARSIERDFGYGN